MSSGSKPLPKFGEWDVNNPASAEGFTVIFNRARDQKKTGGNDAVGGVPPPPRFDQRNNNSNKQNKQNLPKKWLSCFFR